MRRGAGLVAGVALTLYLTASQSDVLGFPLVLVLLAAVVLLAVSPRRRPEALGFALGGILAFGLMLASLATWSWNTQCAWEGPDGTVVTGDCR